MNQIAYGSAMSDPLGALIYCGCNHRIDPAVVNGRIEVENGELVSASEQELVRRAKENGVRVYAFSDALVAESEKAENPTVILGYGGLSKEQILEGIARLKQVWL